MWSSAPQLNDDEHYDNDDDVDDDDDDDDDDDEDDNDDSDDDDNDDDDDDDYDDNEYWNANLLSKKNYCFEDHFNKIYEIIWQRVIM